MYFSTIFHHNLDYFQKLSFIYIKNISFQVCFEFGKSSTFEYFYDSPAFFVFIFSMQSSHIFALQLFTLKTLRRHSANFHKIFIDFLIWLRVSITISISLSHELRSQLQPSTSSTHFSQDLDVFLSIKVSYPARIALKLENIFLSAITCQHQSCQGLTFSSEYFKINLIWFVNEYSSLSLMEI